MPASSDQAIAIRSPIPLPATPTRRDSRFREGSEHVGDQAATTDTFLLSVLLEMDKYDKKAKDSVNTPTVSPSRSSRRGETKRQRNTSPFPLQRNHYSELSFDDGSLNSSISSSSEFCLKKMSKISFTTFKELKRKLRTAMYLRE
ncbi:hypothetical protein K3495_g5263 [Podosphaera aphanis]|nr:hypothetical protein K3495_g5263 [Podosphaera aphanis]